MARERVREGAADRVTQLHGLLPECGGDKAVRGGYRGHGGGSDASRKFELTYSLQVGGCSINTLL